MRVVPNILFLSLLAGCGGGSSVATSSIFDSPVAVGATCQSSALGSATVTADPNGHVPTYSVHAFASALDVIMSDTEVIQKSCELIGTSEFQWEVYFAQPPALRTFKVGVDVAVHAIDGQATSPTRSMEQSRLPASIRLDLSAEPSMLDLVKVAVYRSFLQPGNTALSDFDGPPLVVAEGVV